MSKFTGLQTAHIKANLIPANSFQQLSYWPLLSASDKKVVEARSQALAAALVLEATGKIHQGMHLAELQKVLEPYRVFVRHLQTLYRKMSVKTAYRRIGEYENARKRFSEPVLKAVMARGLEMVGDTSDRPFGKYTTIIKQLPPPKTEDKYQISEWLDRVELKYRAFRSDARNGIPVGFSTFVPSPETLLVQAFRHARMRAKRVPKQQQKQWIQHLTSYLLTEIGASSPVTISPELAPENFRRGPGKPRSNGLAD